MNESDENIAAYGVAEAKAKMQAIKDHGLVLIDVITRLGTSRELSIAKTKVEEAVMWAVKHITR